MSHIAKIEIEIKDLEALKAACARIGCTYVEGQRTYKWYGVSIGDYPLPSGYTAHDLGHCDHAIRVPGAAYEIGVVRRRDGKPGYHLLWDFWAEGGLQQQLGTNGGRLIQAYGIEATRRIARGQGYHVTETTQEDGSVVLRLRSARGA